jgi:tRNA (guanine-N7-)-methyltransferase
MTGAPVETLLPTTRHRRGRRTARQERALADPGPALLDLEDLSVDAVINGDMPLVLDIGFGSGKAVVTLAEADPDTAILAVDMHSPGIGDLLASTGERGLLHVRVVDADIRQVLPLLPRSRLAGVRTFFPDPWPKKRHHRRRLITTHFADDLAACVIPGGYWHIATDWPEYADAIEVAVSQSDAWTGGRIPRPASRPVTRYEQRGLAADREPIDLWFVT